MRSLKTCTLLVVAFSSVACYHATVTTNRSTSGQTVEVPWAHSFLYGLVPPSTVETASQCPNGLARVETMHSFLNGLAAAITFGIYTPMHIIVQCAAAGGADAAADGASFEVDREAPEAEQTAAFQRAVEHAATGATAYVVFE